MSGLLAKKPLQSALGEAKGDHLRRVLGPWALTALGIGAIIGSGIFVTTGKAANQIAGPALMISYVLAGLTCLFAALCYAEFAAMTPVAGSAYTYAYTTLGEIFAWIIGWDLILEYAVGASTVATGWSAYFSNFLTLFPPDWGLTVPAALNESPLAYKDGKFVATDGVINLPAVLIILALTGVLMKGIKESANLNAVMVAIKVGAVLFVILVGMVFVNPANWDDFAPYGWTGINVFGYQVLGEHRGDQPIGMIAGAAIIFFAYIGFDAVSTQAEESKNPQRDMPIGIIGSLVICTVLYIAVVIVLTGMVRYDQLDTKAAVSEAFAQVGMKWAKSLIGAAALAGLTSVLLVMLLGSARVLMAMSRDGLLPPFFSAIHPGFKTPCKGTAVVGLGVALMAGLLPLDALLEMTNIGTLFAFAVVSGAVLVMRYSNPDAPRPFRCPLVPIVPGMGVLACLLLMLSLPAHNWYRLFGWMAIGLVVYFGYGRGHSVLGRRSSPAG
ncbi:MAG: amino acid/polyamine/organocation transporter, superfamily [Gemmataceae bacterium]|nr:amino acid/polyamine/organocation transporter, superfamily [Gemmataceae bacterium]